jgi:hypothetical protein
MIKYIEKLTENLLIDDSSIKGYPYCEYFQCFFNQVLLKKIFQRLLSFLIFYEYNNVFSMSLNNLRLIQISNFFVFNLKHN